MFTFNACYLAASIETLLFTIGIIKQIKDEKEKNNKLQIEAITDKLTNLYNRRYFEETVTYKIVELDKKKSTISMLIIDIDHFKNVNDTYGHNIGDSVLAKAAMIIKQCLRNEDILVRWGGEEFVVILPFTNVQEGTVIAEKIRTSMESHIFKYVNKITVSIGVAEKIAEESFEDWFKMVDKAMYKAKESGRNRVCVSNLNVIPIRIE
jgi:diguanylate cyclase (GGDEF)-like protein